MCGIAGQISLNNTPISGLNRTLVAMSNLIAHRGPDGEGQWQSDNDQAGMVHRRLSVIDLTEAAAQPMKAENGNVITYNGEIYNYLEVRSALENKWNFQTHSDTECILAAYEYHGVTCLDKMRGMFAFGLWDEKRQRLFCARDRFGIKPFYYSLYDAYQQ